MAADELAMRLRQTLLIYLVPLLLFPVMLFGLLAIKYSQSYHWQQANLTASYFLAEQRLAISEELSFYRHQLKTLVANQVLDEYLQSPVSNADPLNVEFADFMRSQAESYSLKLVRLNGQVEISFSKQVDEVSSNRFRQRYITLLQSMIQEDMFFFAPGDDTAEQRLFVAHKVYAPQQEGHDSKLLWGYLILGDAPERLKAILQQSLTPGSISLLISQSATIAFSDRPQLIGSTFAPSHFRTIQKSVQQQEMEKGWLLGQPMLLKGAELPGGFQLLVGINQQELMKNTLAISWVITALLIGVLVLLPFSIYRLLIRHVFGPIRKLTQAKTAVGRGDLSILLPVQKQDELGDMFAAFNVMVRQLRVYRDRERAYKQQLEEKVLKRTQDLARANDDLAGANHELIIARETAEQASRLKSVFLANMSHEIRTPLTAIIGFSEQSVKENDAGKIQDYQHRVLKSSQHLLNLINDILDLSKIEADKLELQLESFHCLEIIDDVFQLTRGQAEAKGLDCELQWMFPLPEMLKTDSVRFRQVLLNLTSNAVKFTQEGKIIVRVEHDLMNQHFCIAVKDTGIGIAPSELSRLFQPFVQADSTVTRHFGGTGLGLCISKKLMQQMGGDIHVESVKGVGSNFEIRLDCAGMDSHLVHRYQPPVISVKEPQEQQQSPLHILVAEDNPDNQLLLSILLKQVNASFVIAANGHEAVEQVLNADFDLIFMDMQMPEMGGEEATELIRHAGIQTPIIAVTANVMSEDIERYKRSGCQSVLSKPINQQQFLAVVQSHRKDASTDDFLQLEKTLAQDPVIQALKQRFKEKLPALIELLQIAFDQQEWDRLAFEAHSLKGSAGSMGFPNITELAAELEHLAHQQLVQPCNGVLLKMLEIIRKETMDA